MTMKGKFRRIILAAILILGVGYYVLLLPILNTKQSDLIKGHVISAVILNRGQSDDGISRPEQVTVRLLTGREAGKVITASYEFNNTIAPPITSGTDVLLTVS